MSSYSMPSAFRSSQRSGNIRSNSFQINEKNKSSPPLTVPKFGRPVAADFLAVGTSGAATFLIPKLHFEPNISAHDRAVRVLRGVDARVCSNTFVECPSPSESSVYIPSSPFYLFQTTPNMDYCPQIHSLTDPMVIRPRQDGRLAEHDFTQYPQFYSASHPHACCTLNIKYHDPRSPLSEADLLWFSGFSEEFFLPDEEGSLLGCLESSALHRLVAGVELIEREAMASSHQNNTPGFATGLKSRLETARVALDRLKLTKFTLDDLRVAVPELQRTVLDLKAFIEWELVVKHRLHDEDGENKVQPKYVGAWTDSSVIAIQLYKAGIPVWLMQPEWSIYPDEIVIRSSQLCKGFQEFVVVDHRTVVGAAGSKTEQPYSALWDGVWEPLVYEVVRVPSPLLINNLGHQPQRGLVRPTLPAPSSIPISTNTFPLKNPFPLGQPEQIMAKHHAPYRAGVLLASSSSTPSSYPSLNSINKKRSRPDSDVANQGRSKRTSMIQGSGFDKKYASLRFEDSFLPLHDRVGERYAAFLPLGIPLWERCRSLVNKDKSLLYDSSLIQLGYAFPPITSFGSGDSDQALCHWLAYRESYITESIQIISIANKHPRLWHSLKIPSPKAWTSFVNIQHINKNAVTISGQRNRENLTAVYNWMPSKQPVDKLMWGEIVISLSLPLGTECQIPNQFIRWAFWELNELNFRYELSLLDRAEMTSNYDNEIDIDTVSAERELRLRECFGGGSVISNLDPCKGTGICARRWQDRRQSLLALLNLMVDWANARPEWRDWVVERYVPSTERELVEMERSLAVVYCQLFFNHFGRAPTTPRCRHEQDLA